MLGGEAVEKLILESGAGARELIQGHGDGRHSLELILIGSADVLFSGSQNLMGWTVMPGEVDDEAFDHGIRDSLVLEEQMDIKEIPGMLAIKGGNEFATVELRMGQRGHPKFCEEEI